MAKQRLPRCIFDFFDGGAEDEVALRQNRTQFEKFRLIPRVLRNVERPDLATTVLGMPSAMPIVIGPTGGVGYGRRGGDLAIARAASRKRIPYTLSTSATASIGEVASVVERKWFQAYVFKDRKHTLRLIAMAADASYEALMITVDLPVGGKRERDYRNDFSVPFRYTLGNVLGFASKPAWSVPMLVNGIPRMPSLEGLSAQPLGRVAMASSVGRNYDPSFGWADLEGIRRFWSGKLVVKGIMHVDDAIRAASMGCDAIVISNHGGRQLDAGAAPLEVLPAVAAAVGDRIDLMIDGGIRRGSDVLIALALGARAVLIGRPTLYGVIADGEAGAVRALDILQDELYRTMQLCGITQLADVNSRYLQRTPASG